MATNPVRFGYEQALLCPVCDGEHTHVYLAHISARPQEDGPFNEIRVDAGTGQVSTHLPAPGPEGIRVGAGRRYRISLLGYCEEKGCEFSIVLTQHKGVTYVELAPTSGPTTTE